MGVRRSGVRWRGSNTWAPGSGLPLGERRWFVLKRPRCDSLSLSLRHERDVGLYWKDRDATLTGRVKPKCPQLQSNTHSNIGGTRRGCDACRSGDLDLGRCRPVAAAVCVLDIPNVLAAAASSSPSVHAAPAGSNHSVAPDCGQ